MLTLYNKLGKLMLEKQFYKMGKFYYAVRKGRNPGVYSTWPQCKAQVHKFPYPKFRKFATEAEAWDFVNAGTTSNPSCSNTIEDGTSSFSQKPATTNSLYAAIKREPEGTNFISNSLYTDIKREPEDTNFISNSLYADIKREPEDIPGPPAKRFKTYKKDNKDSITAQPAGVDDCMVYVYTDGACTQNGKVGAKAAIGVYWGPDHELNVSERLGGRQTNNRAEIHAAVRALQQAKAKNYKHVTLYTDSNFVVNAMTKWIRGWKKNGWKLASGGPVINKEDFLELDAAAAGLNVYWVHVRGHQGLKGNEEADRLAVAGLQYAKPYD